ncbi:uncharacterized protein LOC131952558 [Physella acuta]|uniref:uncharacterized protein LOC131952558 n=1 Tax=Physella acuta TaxID=109671 RepID=UPI0027DDD723|nr:uncharacterized protein LOC131952558 [Physella acuta]
MHTPLEPTKRVLELISYLTLVVCLVSLILSRVLHSTHCDDAYEMNRVRLEMRTTMIIAQVAAIQVLYFSPLIITESIVYYDNSESMFERDVVHFCYELALHSTYVLFLVLMGRREFRRSLRYVFARSEAIRRQRQPNYIVASETSRKRKSQSTLTVATPPLAEMTARDDTMQMDTPEWLRRKQSLLQSILGRADSVTPDQ